jgi:thiamine pyrophosphokinase
MKCLILSGGTPPGICLLNTHLKTAGLFIGVDGAADLLCRYDIVPDVLIGDFDTADAASVSALGQRGAKVTRLESEKNDTDTEAAVEYALKAGADDIVILGALGGRVDHMMSNIMMLVRAEMSGVACRIIDEQCEMFVSNKSFMLSGHCGQVISILPLTGEVCVNAHGLKYPLDDLVLRWGSSRGISNVMQGIAASISITGGYALIVKNTLPSQKF